MTLVKVAALVLALALVLVQEQALVQAPVQALVQAVELAVELERVQHLPQPATAHQAAAPHLHRMQHR